jgi:hypothetical protein
LAPIPSASTSTAHAVNPGVFISMRTAKPHVLQHAFDRRQREAVGVGLARLLRASEPDERPPFGFLPATDRPNASAVWHLDVAPQLLGELALAPAAGERGPAIARSTRRQRFMTLPGRKKRATMSVGAVPFASRGGQLRATGSGERVKTCPAVLFGLAHSPRMAPSCSSLSRAG